MSIKTKIILIVNTVLIITGLSMASLIYWQNNRILTNHLNNDLSITINYTSELINNYIGQVERSLLVLAKDPLTTNALEAKDPALFNQISQNISDLKKGNHNIENISVMEVSGASCTPRAANEEAISLVGRDFSNRDYCQGVIRTKERYLSSSYISAIDNKPVLGLVIPVKNTSEEMIGFVYASINLTDLRLYISNLQENSKVELLDRDGKMFLNTEEEIINFDIPLEGEEEEISEIKRAIAESKSEGFFSDEDNIIGYKIIGPITIIFEKSAASLLSLNKTVNISLFISLAISIFVMFIVIFFFIGKITSRISRLSKVSQDIAAGNFNSELKDIDSNSSDEISVLTKAFNTMALNLKDIYSRLDQKVKERTEKLEASELVLKKTLADSERLNKLMVGRELEMLKLKKEIIEYKNIKK